jgi:hypothetical protein
MHPYKIVSPLKIDQLDPDLQTRLMGLPLTTLRAFQTLASQVQAIQEQRWAVNGRPGTRERSA